MKLAWLVKRYEDDDWQIVFEEPDRFFHEIRQIAYVELATGAPA